MKGSSLIRVLQNRRNFRAGVKIRLRSQATKTPDRSNVSSTWEIVAVAPSSHKAAIPDVTTDFVVGLLSLAKNQD